MITKLLKDNASLELAILTLIGGLWVSNIFFRILNFIYVHFLRRSSITKYKHTWSHHSSATTPWAIITGSTDGIGKAYVYELANLGFNIVLHGRNGLKLHHVRHELQNEFPHLQFRIMQLDAANSGPESLKMIKEAVEAIKDLHVTVLINNVGTGAKNDGPTLQSFIETSPEDVDLLININARFPVQFTRAVLPLLMSHGGPALILTMGSMSDVGMPYMATYASAKSLDLGFSRALRRDIKTMGRDNIEVLGIMPAGVTDVSWDKTASGLLRPKSREFAKKALGMVGCGKEVVAPWWTHALMWEMLKAFPAWVLDLALVKGTEQVMKDQPELSGGKKA
ncbi:NAD(P)-binding protein [Acephala macrosclerotiorum]|nr:NAD(P)-binding protein [Acephala macrosclerotiorum]